MNNDCIVADPAFLDQAIEFTESRPDCGIASGKILFWPETTRIWSTGGCSTVIGAEKYIGLGELDAGQHDQPSERNFLSGAYMLIKKEVTIGLLPEAYFFGTEDWEYSLRSADKCQGRAPATELRVPFLVEVLHRHALGA